MSSLIKGRPQAAVPWRCATKHLLLSQGPRWETSSSKLLHLLQMSGVF